MEVGKKYDVDIKRQEATDKLVSYLKENTFVQSLGGQQTNSWTKKVFLYAPVQFIKKENQLCVT